MENVVSRWAGFLDDRHRVRFVKPGQVEKVGILVELVEHCAGSIFRFR